MQSLTTELRVWSRRAEALDVVSIDLRAPQDLPLPPFTPGAHLEIALPSGHGGPPLVRHYSLCNDPSERHRYVIAIGRNDEGRGGSVAAHELLHQGMLLMARPPRNHFGFTPDAACYRFIAGGIGITPILSMVRWCERQGKPWSLLYFTRGRHRTAFYEELRAYGGRVRFHFADEEDGLADLIQAMQAPQPDEHVYCCGPTGLMQAVEAEGTYWPKGSVHFEWFSAPACESESPSRAFDIVLRRAGKRLNVPPDRSILETLEANRIEVPFACREGLCRTCETPLCAGEAEHLDYVLSDEERNAQRSLLICVSRARSPVLELDI